MSLVALTIQDPDNPNVLVNPAQVCTIKGRKGYRPDVASQQGGVQSFPQGAEISLSNGDRLNVTESQHEAHTKLFPEVGPKGAAISDKTVVKKAPAKLAGAGSLSATAEAKHDDDPTA